ncbi:hypothetical protein [Pseudosporangium ferrugineum]|uniref:Uncharacterized protein n=1 Tax=Pseudosporangium ferrugineum TaxID=439699 RepID=A0A2T0RG38_9ACTN|nr:hypothetical protein [Pseudosporangium ferrugineum]PRY20125.1 hypothetical protein CLV70_1256 [Pseudosporangium ferrugineum]
MAMRIFLVTLAVAGVLVTAAGTLMSIGVLILVGAGLFVVALVMGALAAPRTRRGR